MSLVNEHDHLTAILVGAGLPALPQSAIRLLELAQNSDNGPGQFAIPIESDPGLASQVLRFVNSSFFGFRREIASVKLAISLIGIRTVQNFVLWSAVFTTVPNPRCGSFELKRLWQDSLRRGIFARALGVRLNLCHPEELFAFALLQDMAVPVLAKELPDAYSQLLAAREGGLHRLSDLERDRFGWNHGQAGAQLARKWHLPESIANAIANHVVTTDNSADDFDPAWSVVGLSALLPSTADLQWQDRDTFLATLEFQCGDSTATAQSLLAQVDREFAQFAPFMKLPTPAISLVDSLAVASSIDGRPPQ